ncbi:MAG: helix-turn-helix transcriptional regulator [Algicola sp.]|nr:helix-turn-helix transcriptional regulator [Algicola sp.]
MTSTPLPIAPLPGEKVRGSESGRPIMALFDLLGRRWTMRILWELNQNHRTFRELQQCCGKISPTVLNQRLKDLREAALVVAVDKQGYQLTETGKALMLHIEPMREWAQDWAEQLK